MKSTVFSSCIKSIKYIGLFCFVFALVFNSTAQDTRAEVLKLFENNGVDIVMDDGMGTVVEYSYSIEKSTLHQKASLGVDASLAIFLKDIKFNKAVITKTKYAIDNGTRLPLYSLDLPPLKDKTIYIFNSDGKAVPYAGNMSLMFSTQALAEKALEYLKELPEGGTTAPTTTKTSETANTTKTDNSAKQAKKISTSPADDSDFCLEISNLLWDAANNFDNIVDTNHFEKIGSGLFSETRYDCKVQVKGTVKTTINVIIFRRASVKIGEYVNYTDARKQADAFVKKLKECYPNYYFFNKADEGGGFSIQIGANIENGYASAMAKIEAKEDELNHKVTLHLYVERGVPKVFFYNIPNPPVSTDFSTAINKIYLSIPDDFKAIRSTEHKSENSIYADAWYELNVSVPGATNAYADIRNVLNYRPKECAVFFSESEKIDEAKASFEKLSQLIMESFGSDFVYTYDNFQYSGDIFSGLIPRILPPNPEDMIVFMNKKERSNETVGVCALVMYKDEDGKHQVYLSFFRDNL